MCVFFKIGKNKCMLTNKEITYQALHFLGNQVCIWLFSGYSALRDTLCYCITKSNFLIILKFLPFIELCIIFKDQGMVIGSGASILVTNFFLTTKISYIKKMCTFSDLINTLELVA